MDDQDNTAKELNEEGPEVILPRPETPPALRTHLPVHSGKAPDDVTQFKELSVTRITMPAVLYTGLLIGGAERQIISDEVRKYLNADMCVNISANFYRAKKLGLCHTEKAGIHNRNYITLYKDKIEAYFKTHNIHCADLEEVIELARNNPEQIAQNHTEYAEKVSQKAAGKKAASDGEARQTEAILGEQEKQAVDVLSGIIEASNRKDRLLRQIRSLIDAELGDAK